MLKKHKNILLEIKKENGLNLEMFTAKDVENEHGDKVFEIKVNNTPLKFNIRNTSSYYNELMCNYIQFTHSFPMSGCGWTNIEKINEYFSKWVKNHVIEYINEIETHDIWQQIKIEQTIISGDALNSDDISYFSIHEKQQLRLSLNEYKVLILNEFNPLVEEIKLINSRFDYLSESLDKLNKFDWRSLLFSILTSISIALSLDTEKGKLLFDLFAQVFEGLKLIG